MDGDDRLDVENVRSALVLADVVDRVVLKRHADEIGDGVLHRLGEISAALFFLTTLIAAVIPFGRPGDAVKQRQRDDRHPYGRSLHRAALRWSTHTTVNRRWRGWRGRKRPCAPSSRESRAARSDRAVRGWRDR